MANDNRDFFFCDYQPSYNVTSFSVGDIWLYFYKETLIAVRDITADRVWALKTNHVEPDGYSNRHEIGQKIIEMILSEVYQAESQTLLTAPELSSQAIQLVAESIVQHVDRALIP